MRILLLIIKACLAAAGIALAAAVRLPVTAEFRPWPLIVVVAGALVLMALSLRWRRWRTGRRIDRLELAPFALAAIALVVALTVEGSFQRDRYTVLHADAAALEPFGRHIIVGYHDPAFVRDLVERRAVGGIFLTHGNVAGRDAAAVAHEIGALQAIRSRQGLPPLFIATDQEGGGVSRLSPPLDQQPPLAQVIRGLHDTGARRAAVAAYAARQGKGLADLGVNLNFAPVVDLDFGIDNPNDAYTRISTRAIAADAATVNEVAGWYCDGLAAQGVACTLKHFPGLGRVFEDTHMREATLTATLPELEAADWIPFRRLLGGASHAVMIGHVQLAPLDATEPASISRPVITGLLRDQWHYDGLVITDDMCMGAIAFHAGGIARSSVRALNAGVDLLLISWEGEQIYPALAALLRARSTLDAQMLRRSDARLQALQTKLPAGPSAE